jgi:hypothetical protein
MNDQKQTPSIELLSATDCDARQDSLQFPTSRGKTKGIHDTHYTEGRTACKGRLGRCG